MAKKKIFPRDRTYTNEVEKYLCEQWSIQPDSDLVDKVHELAVEFKAKVGPKWEQANRTLSRILDHDENGNWSLRKNNRHKGIIFFSFFKILDIFLAKSVS